MDLLKLPEILRTGQRIPQDDDHIVLISPLGRFSFPNLVKPRRATNADGTLGRPTYGLRLVWNWNNPDQPGHVNVNAVLNPAILELANRYGMRPKGWLTRGDDEKLQREDGSFPDGLGPGFVFASINAAAENKDGSARPAPLVRDPQRREINPGLVKPGYYGRVVMSLYVVDYGAKKLCFGLEEVQLLAKGELLGGGGARDYGDALGSVDGADSFEDEGPASQFDGGGDDPDTGFDANGDRLPF